MRREICEHGMGASGLCAGPANRPQAPCPAGGRARPGVPRGAWSCAESRLAHGLMHDFVPSLGAAWPRSAVLTNQVAELGIDNDSNGPCSGVGRACRPSPVTRTTGAGLSD